LALPAAQDDALEVPISRLHALQTKFFFQDESALDHDDFFHDRNYRGVTFDPHWRGDIDRPTNPYAFLSQPASASDSHQLRTRAISSEP
jgi:hypothetical protein